MNHSILVTGATGIIGREVVAQLKAADIPFDVLSAREFATPDSAIRRGDFDDTASLTAAFSGVHTLFVLLPLAPGKVQRARNVAAAAKAAGVQHIVRSSGLVLDTAAPYSLPRLQREIDEILASTGIACTFLRNATYMQNYLSFKAPMVRAGIVYGATANAPESLIDARDIAQVAAIILNDPKPHAGQAYVLTGAEALTDTERMAQLSQVLGREVVFQSIPPEAAAAAMRDDWKLPVELVDWLDSLNRLVSAGLAASVSDDVKRLTGRAPRSFAQFARDNAARWA
ncbi:hypothetical protein B0T40_10550 [Chromobacterium haemolyticum]|uniref:NmrA family NAD(P)-binding protein n=1 Tax=Chromobacterium haemolyticum TaxID=394935 RepID=UPI0009DA70CB|nr:NmrA family NAD(P)-binding protein [Chromobacterium haemolyticum]OQS36817.1 hypothetical protein B0T40_10550 [Chromobacterium haemolyticum]